MVNYYLVGLLLVKKIVESHKKMFNVKINIMKMQ